MDVIKNFLPEEEYKNIKNIVLSSHFPWFYNDTAVPKIDEKIPQFTHSVYENYVPVSTYYRDIIPILKKLNPVTLFRIKFNLNYKTPTVVETGIHSDIYPNEFRYKSAVMFFNTCDGYCRIGDEKIMSEDNKLLIFDAHENHTGSTCSNTDRRIVLSLIYASRENK